MDWVDKQEQKREEDSSKMYFNIGEGHNRFLLLSSILPLAQVWDNSAKKYRPAEEGDENITVKGVCWVLQDEAIKLAKLPYTVVKQLRAYQTNEEWGLDEFPWKNLITLNAKNAGQKEVEYSLTISPKETPIDDNIIDELNGKDSIEDVISAIKNKQGGDSNWEETRERLEQDEPKSSDIAF